MNVMIIGSIGVIVLLLFIWWIVIETKKLNLPGKDSQIPISRLTRKQLKRRKLI